MIGTFLAKTTGFLWNRPIRADIFYKTYSVQFR